MDHQQYQYHQIKEIIFLQTIYLHLNRISSFSINSEILGPGRLTDFFPMPIINVMAVLSLFDNPSWITFAPLGHSECEILLEHGTFELSTVEKQN